MQKQLNTKMPIFMYNIPLLDSEFDSTPEETFVSIMAQAEFNDAEHTIAILN
jgi:hypothetical protein